MVINKKIKRTILENKSQYIGSLILIIISCLLFTMFNQLAQNMSYITSAFITDYKQEDASFITSSPLDGILDLEDKFNATIEESLILDYNFAEGKVIRLFSENTKVNIPAIVEGHKLNKKEILLDPSFANANKLNIGDDIIILNDTFKIAGYMSLPNYIYPLKSESDIISDPNNFGIGVISKEDFLSLGKGNLSYSIKFNDLKTPLDKQSNEFRNQLKDKNIFLVNWTDISDNKRVTYVTTKMDGINQMSIAAPVAILILTCILVGIVMLRLINNESIIIGTLYAQGYRKYEIRNHYMLYPLIIGIIGGIIGTFLGTLALRPMLSLMVSFFNIPVSQIKFNFFYIFLSLLLPNLFLGISSLFILNKELKHSPLELMRGDMKDSKINFIERKLKLNKFKFDTKFKIRQQLRSLSRLTFLLLGVTAASMLLLFGLTEKTSVDYLLRDSIKEAYKFQYEYIFNKVQTENAREGTEVFHVSTFTLKSDYKISFVISGIESDSKYIWLMDKNKQRITPNQVIMTRPLALRLKVKPGDTVQVVNKFDLNEYSIRIDKVSESYFGEYIFMPIYQYNSMINATLDSYNGLWSNKKLDIEENLLYSSTGLEDSTKAFETLLQPITSTIGVIAVMAFIIGLIVIYVVTSMMIEENKINISLMKVFGYKDKEVNSLILNSSTAIVIIGYLLAIPILLSTLRAWFDSLTTSLHMTMPVKVNVLFIILGLVIVLLIYELSKLLSRKKINKISMSEALKATVE